MDLGYDKTNLHALRRDLERLNDAATTRESAAPRKGQNKRPKAPDAAKRGPKKSADKAAQLVTVQIPAPAIKTAAKGKGAGKAPAGGAIKKRARAGSADKGKDLVPVAVVERPRVDASDKGKAAATRLLKMLARDEGDESPIVPGTQFTESGVVRLLAHLRKPRSLQFRFLQRLLRVLTRPIPLGTRTSAGISVERLQLVSRQLAEIETRGWHRFQRRRAARRARQAISSQFDKPPKQEENAAPSENVAAPESR